MYVHLYVQYVSYLNTPITHRSTCSPYLSYIICLNHDSILTILSFIVIIIFRAFVSDFGDDDKGKNRKMEEAKEKENVSKYKEAFDQIKKIVGSDASLEKITRYMVFEIVQ